MTIKKTPWQRLIGLIATDRKEIYYVLIYAAAGGVINLILPLGIQAIVGLISGGTISSSWGILTFIVAAGTGFAGALKVMQLSVTETLQRKIFVRNSFDFAYRFPRLPIESVSRVHLPEVANRFFDTLNIQKGLPKILIDITEALLQILFGLVLIALYHPFFIAFGIMLALLLFGVFKLTFPKGIESSLQESKYKYLVANWLEEIARTMVTFKLHGDKDLPLKKIDGLVSNYLDARAVHFRVLSLQYTVMIIYKIIITFSLLILGSILVIENQINLGQFVAAEIVIILITNSVEKFIVSMDTIYDVLTALEKFEAVTDLPIESTQGVDFKGFDNKEGMSISLNNVSLKFKDDNRNVINNLNLEIKSNEKICIAGYNTSGKTTLVRLISCLLTQDSGIITYNNIPRNNINIESLRAKIGDFSEVEDLFVGSILENITMGEDIKLTRIVEICQKIGLHNYIIQLSNGYETQLLPAGKNIPKTIATKIILARCIISEPELLALENFSTQIEKQERAQIIDYLTNDDKNWTLVAVSNDLYFASQCDRIILMKYGEIIADGSFEQLRKTEDFKAIFG